MLKLEEMLKTLLVSEKAESKWMEPMSSHTTFRIGGPARAYVSPGTEEELAQVLKLCREQEVPFAILGNGSNLLVGDKGFSGVIISLKNGWSELALEGSRLRAGGGQLLSRSARAAWESGLQGMEFAAGIPGTVGGALVMNAGAYGSEMKDILSRVRVMTPDGEVKWLEAGELKLGYRTSCIPEKGYVVLEAEFSLQPGDREGIREKMEELAARRREKQPLEYPSAGSTFKRPEGHFAGKLIEEAGLKGYTVGGAQVSEKHCGFVINRGGARAADVMELCAYVQERVKENAGVELEMEVKRLGDF